MYYLLKWAGNWADEMDLDGHVVLTKGAYKQFTDALQKLKEHGVDWWEFYVGTNEEVIYENIDDIFESFSTTLISQEEYDVLEKLDLLYGGFAESFVEFIIESAMGLE